MCHKTREPGAEAALPEEEGAPAEAGEEPGATPLTTGPDHPAITGADPQAETVGPITMILATMMKTLHPLTALVAEAEAEEEATSAP